MLNRRYLRIKVLQAVYAFFVSGNDDISRGEKELWASVSKTREMYFFLLRLLTEIHSVVGQFLEEEKAKNFPGQSEIHTYSRFLSLKPLAQLAQNSAIEKFCRENGLSWTEKPEIVRRLAVSFKNSSTREAIHAIEPTDYAGEIKFLIDFYKEHVVQYEYLETWFEDKSIYWADEVDFCHAMVMRTLGQFDPQDPKGTTPFELYKNEAEDTEFIRDLFRQTLINSEKLEQRISEKTRNWDVDRIALMDIILMKLAITEITHFYNISVKVSLNEYIELSKSFSTPRSRVFINGILDKMVQDLRRENLVKKVGRGLIE